MALSAGIIIILGTIHSKLLLKLQHVKLLVSKGITFHAENVCSRLVSNQLLMVTAMYQ